MCNAPEENRARYYNPQTGRFLSEDPLEFGGEDMNLYRYVWNAPADLIDPTGQIGFGVGVGGAAEGGVIAAGAGGQVSGGAGGFLNTNNWSPSAGAFASGVRSPEALVGVCLLRLNPVIVTLFLAHI